MFYIVVAMAGLPGAPKIIKHDVPSLRVAQSMVETYQHLGIPCEIEPDVFGYIRAKYPRLAHHVSQYP